MRQSIPLLLILSLTYACNRKESHPTFEREAVKQEVTQMLHDYHKAVTKEGLRAEFNYLDSSDNFFWVPPGMTTALDFDTIKAILGQNHKGLNEVSFDWESLKVYPLSKRIANYTGIVAGSTTDTAGVKSEMRIIESGTVIKREDGWKLLSGQSRTL